MNYIKSFFRGCIPYGLLEKRRRIFRLRRLEITKTKNSLAELDDAAQLCRFELWPPELRRASHNWVLVDVGANVGDYVAAVLKLVSPQKVVAIEPLPSCHAQLECVLRASPNNHLIKAAAGDTKGEIEIYYTGDSKMSSVLPPLAEIEAAYHPGDYTTREMIKVPLVRIDDVVPKDSQVGILKIDVQGFELAALRGAEETLKRTKAIQLEINYAPHYKGAAGFDDVHNFLVARGFQLYGVSAPYFGSGRPLWADAVYCRNA